MKTTFKNGELKLLVDIIKSESKYDLSYNDYVAKKIFEEGKIEEANSKLEKMAKKILELYQDIMLKDEQSERE